MRNFIQSGHTLTAIMAVAVSSGDGVLIGGMFGVASTDGAIGEEVELQVDGVFDLPKTSANEPTQFAIAYWDPDLGEVTTTAATNYRIGVFMSALASGTVTANVRLDGIATVQESA